MGAFTPDNKSSEGNFKQLVNRGASPTADNGLGNLSTDDIAIPEGKKLGDTLTSDFDPPVFTADTQH